MEQQDILSMTLPELQAAVQELSEPKFRAKQIFNWLHQKRVTDFSEMTTLSLPFRERLASDFCINRLKIAKRLASSVDDTVKYLYELPSACSIPTAQACAFQHRWVAGWDVGSVHLPLQDSCGT